jgi:hypothetical protein
VIERIVKRDTYKLREPGHGPRKRRTAGAARVPRVQAARLRLDERACSKRRGDPVLRRLYQPIIGTKRDRLALSQAIGPFLIVHA